jgi:transcriptional regulator with XRE-family HTH domain
VSSVEAKYSKLLGKVAANIKRVRKSKNLSQPDMEKLGFDLRNFQRLESGHHSPSLYTLHKLAIAYKVDVIEFFR